MIGGLSIEADVRMDHHPVIRQHPIVDSLSHRRGNVLLRRSIDEKHTRLENQRDSWAEVSAAPLPIRERCPHDEHLTTFERKLPQRIFGSPHDGWKTFLTGKNQSRWR